MPSRSRRSRGCSWERIGTAAKSACGMSRPTCARSSRSWVSRTFCPSDLGVEARGQAEEREERRGVEEEGELGDPVGCELDDLQRPRHVTGFVRARLALTVRTYASVVVDC